MGLVVFFIFGVGAFRVIRFSGNFALQRQPEELTSEQRLSFLMAILFFMGPAEALIPLFSKLQGDGAPLAAVLISFWLGTFMVAGIASVVFRIRMGDPYRRVRGLFELSRPAPMLPSVFVLALLSAWILKQ